MLAQMLAPAAALVAWSLVVLFWMVVTRFAGLAKTDVDLGNAPPGGRGQDLEPILPAKTNWKSHNYTHLMEQPTIFYPTVVVIALMGAGPTDILFAWAYVAIRIVHSLWQTSVNRIPVRVVLFTLSTLCLVVLSVRAVMLTIFG
ncbi:MAG TPA: MAPEG family protein [Sphingomonadaceae bacterium]|nr:MAPEG family protein [Sphingomonadaceae bacterium]